MEPTLQDLKYWHDRADLYYELFERCLVFIKQIKYLELMDGKIPTPEKYDHTELSAEAWRAGNEHMTTILSQLANETLHEIIEKQDKGLS